jgi:predicted NBD/HSP70 family sugar kinase
VARAGEWILGPIRRVVAERCRVTPLERVRILPAALGGLSGAIGAAIWAGQQASLRAR